MRFQLEKVFHLVDSETVLNMINKTSTRFKVYEGVRIGEIQASTAGDMSEWAWLSSKENTADWLTRGREPKNLGAESDWWKGPPVLYQDSEKWQIKFGLQREITLPGEKKLAYVSVALSASKNCVGVDFSRFSSIRKLYWVIARLLSISRMKSFKGGSSKFVTVQLLQEAEQLVVKEVQRSCSDEFTDGKGRYKVLSPTMNSFGIMVVGRRLGSNYPMTPEGEAQALLPADHAVTRMLMRDAHIACGHRGRDATLARFRHK